MDKLMKGARKKSKNERVHEMVKRTYVDSLKIEKAMLTNPRAVEKLLRSYYKAEESHSRELLKAFKGFSEDFGQLETELRENQETSALLREILMSEGSVADLDVQETFVRPHYKRRHTRQSHYKVVEERIDEELEALECLDIGGEQGRLQLDMFNAKSPSPPKYVKPAAGKRRY